MRVKDLPELARLSAPEKILLIEELWDSTASDESVVPVPKSHMDELDGRAEKLRIRPWEITFP